MVSEDLRIRFSEVTQEILKAYRDEGIRWCDLESFVFNLVNHNLRYLDHIEEYGEVFTIGEYIKNQYTKESE